MDNANIESLRATMLVRMRESEIQRSILDNLRWRGILAFRCQPAPVPVRKGSVIATFWAGAADSASGIRREFGDTAFGGDFGCFWGRIIDLASKRIAA